MTKVIVAGSRTIGEIDVVHDAIVHSPWGRVYDELVHGGADGVDTLASELHERHNWFESETVFRPDWHFYGKNAGPIRNAEMAEYADALIAVWDGESSGTKNMIETALDHGLDVYVTVVGGNNE